MRSQNKDYCPGFFDLASAGGVVDAGEDDAVGAKRELEEELGLSDLTLTHVVTAKYQPADGSDNLFQNIYVIKDFDDEATQLVLQESEVERMEKWPVTDIDTKLGDAAVKVTPDSRHAWQVYCQNCKTSH